MKKIIVIVFILISIQSYGQWNEVINYTTVNTGTNPLSTNSISSMLIDINNTVWISPLGYSNYGNINYSVSFNCNIVTINDTNWVPVGNELDSILAFNLASDNSGNILINTGSKILKFDIITQELSELIPQLPFSGLNINCIYVAYNNDVWIATQTVGVLRYHNGTITIFSITDGLSDNYVTSIMQVDNGDLWFGTLEGIDIWDGNNWSHMFLGSPLNSSNAIYSLYTDQNGRIWAGGFEYIFMYDGNWNEYTYFSCPYFYYISNNTQAITISSDNTGKMYFGLRGNGILTFDDNNWEWLSKGNELLSNDIRFCSCDTAGTMWFGFHRGGIMSISINQDYRYYTTDGLAEQIVYNIFEDSQNQIWFSTYDGVSRFTNNNWTSFLQYYDLSFSPSIGSIREYNNKIFTSQSNNIHIWENNIWNHINCFMLSLITDIIPIGDDTIYIGHKQGFSRAIGPNYNLGSAYTLYQGLNNDSVNTLALDSNGIVWIGTNDGLAYFDGTNINNMIIPGEVIGNIITDLIFDYNGKLWVSTNHGVGIYNGTSWEYITETDGLINNYVTCLKQCVDSSIWLGTQNGASLYKNNLFYEFTEQDGLINNYILTIEEDHDKNVWFGTFYGVSKINNDTIQNILIPHVNTNKIITLAPNPASNTLQITSSKEINDIKIYNQSGQLIKQVSVSLESTITLDISDLPCGSYFVRVSGKNGSWTEKFVVVR